MNTYKHLYMYVSKYIPNNKPISNSTKTFHFLCQTEIAYNTKLTSLIRTQVSFAQSNLSMRGLLENPAQDHS